MIMREPNPSCQLPEDTNKAVFRYMDFNKFKYFIDKKLYLRRIDLLEDKFECTYSRSQIPEMNKWLDNIGYKKQIEVEKKNRIEFRQKVYVSCWCLYDTDLDLMWKAYVPNKDGVAIKSKVSKLIEICDNPNNNWPDISIIKYYDQAKGKLLNYPGLDPVIHKDLHYRLDKEIRIIYHPNIKLLSPEYLCLDIEPMDLIDEVIVKPKSSIEFIKKIRKIMDDANIKAPLSYSRDDRPVCE